MLHTVEHYTSLDFLLFAQRQKITLIELKLFQIKRDERVANIQKSHNDAEGKVCLENSMNASSFRYIGARVMFFKFSKLLAPLASAI